MDNIRIAHRCRTAKDPKARLARLQAAYAHELMSAEERLELRERIVCLRRRLGL